jgi:hypothetical protein
LRGSARPPPPPPPGAGRCDSLLRQLVRQQKNNRPKRHSGSSSHRGRSRQRWWDAKREWHAHRRPRNTAWMVIAAACRCCSIMPRRRLRSILQWALACFCLQLHWITRAAWRLSPTHTRRLRARQVLCRRAAALRALTTSTHAARADRTWADARTAVGASQDYLTRTDVT